MTLPLDRKAFQERRAFCLDAMKNPKNHAALAFELAYLRERDEARMAGKNLAPNVVVTISGGVLQGCVADQQISVALIDLDIKGMSDHVVHAITEPDSGNPTFADTRMVNVHIDAVLCAQQMRQVLEPVTAAQHQLATYGDSDDMPADYPADLDADKPPEPQSVNT